MVAMAAPASIYWFGNLYRVVHSIFGGHQRLYRSTILSIFFIDLPILSRYLYARRRHFCQFVRHGIHTYMPIADSFVNLCVTLYIPYIYVHRRHICQFVRHAIYICVTLSIPTYKPIIWQLFQFVRRATYTYIYAHHRQLVVILANR